MLTKLRAGALAFAFSSNLSNSGMPEAARVASGPGEIACTRMPFGPSSADAYLTALSGRLSRFHDVVILHHRLAAIVRHCEKSAALFHQGLGKLRHPKKCPTGNLHGG